MSSKDAPVQKLNARHRRFCKEYMVDSNASAAYRRTGYRGRAAEGSKRLMQSPVIQQEIARLQEKAAEKIDAEIGDIVAEYCALAFANVADYMEFDDDGNPTMNLKQLQYDKDLGRNIASVDIKTMGGGTRPVVIETKFKLFDKKAALDSLAKIKGMFIERTESNVNVNVFREEDQAILEDYHQRLLRKNQAEAQRQSQDKEKLH